MHLLGNKACSQLYFPLISDDKKPVTFPKKMEHKKKKMDNEEKHKPEK
jgi:hypothetical protein